jgi:hypothetical protein
VVKRWLPERSIVVVADSSFAALNLLAAVREQLCVVTRLRLDAALYDLAGRSNHGLFRLPEPLAPHVAGEPCTLRDFMQGQLVAQMTK